MSNSLTSIGRINKVNISFYDLYISGYIEYMRSKLSDYNDDEFVKLLIQNGAGKNDDMKLLESLTVQYGSKKSYRTIRRNAMAYVIKSRYYHF